MELEYINFSKLILNDLNPRLPQSLQGDTNIEKLVPYYLFNEDLEPLFGSLSSLGWFPTEPINLLKMYDGTYKVMDGNRRVVACWLLLNSNHPLCPSFVKDIVNEMSEEQLKSLDTVISFVQ